MEGQTTNRTISINEGVITFPGECCMAFNPNYVEVYLYSSYNSVSITLSGNEKSFSVECSLYKGRGRCYISRMMQLLFDENYFNKRCVSATISVGLNGKVIASETLNLIWGCLHIGAPFGLGEVLTKYQVDYSRKNLTYRREVKWFRNFPFSVSFFAPSSSNVLYLTDKYGSKTEVERDNKVIFETIPTDKASRRLLYDIVYGVDEIASTFTNVFDNTFFKQFKYIQAEVNVICSDETQGYYIRWIDQFGFIQYWLFKKGTVTSKNKLGSNFVQVEKEINGVYYGNVNRVTSVENTDTMKCAAINLSEMMIETVETIIKSAHIDLFLGYNQGGEEVWLPINIVAGSYKVNPNKELQDYEIEFTMPTTPTQIL